MSFQQITPSLKKEWWENRKSAFSLPIALTCLLIVGLIVLFVLMDGYQITRTIEALRNPELATKSNFVISMVTVIFGFFIIMSTIVQFFYFLHCLYDDKRDRSIYFWRSLPVADNLNIGIKLFFGALILPAVSLLLASALSVLFLVVVSIILSIGYDVSFWGKWFNSSFFQYLAMLWWNVVLVAIWLFPLYAWLMLMSAFAKQTPFLWAILPIVLLLFGEAFVVNYLELNSGFFIEVLKDYFRAIAADQNTGGVYLVNTSSLKIQLLNFSPNLATKLSVEATLFGCALMYLIYWLRVNRSQE